MTINIQIYAVSPRFDPLAYEESLTGHAVVSLPVLTSLQYIYNEAATILTVPAPEVS